MKHRKKKTTETKCIDCRETTQKKELEKFGGICGICANKIVLK